MKKTKWFNRNSEPVRVGVYQTRTDPSEGGEWFQYWDGKSFRATGTTVERAFQIRWASAGSFSFVEWRGLTERAA